MTEVKYLPKAVIIDQNRDQLSFNELPAGQDFTPEIP
jgi:hypothetical protein